MLSEVCSDDVCSICLENLDILGPDDPKIMLICGGRTMEPIRHCVHASCITKAIKAGDNKCPLCRQLYEIHPNYVRFFETPDERAKREERERAELERERKRSDHRNTLNEEELVTWNRMTPLDQDAFLEKAEARAEYSRSFSELEDSELEYEWNNMTPLEQDVFLAEREKEREEYQPLIHDDWVFMRPNQQDVFLKQLELNRPKDQTFVINLTKKYLGLYESFKAQFTKSIKLTIIEDLTYLTSIKKTLKKK